MKDSKQFTSVKQIADLTEEQRNTLWRWANRSKYDKALPGISGMPLLSVGRCIEFLVDHQIPMKELMMTLADDFHNNPYAELIDVLWDCVCIGLAKSEMNQRLLPKVAIMPSELVTRGSMQQWISNRQWKTLNAGEMARLWQWVLKTPSEVPRIFYDVSDRPMLSIGRLLEFLTDNGMTLKEIFQSCMMYENKEWSKMQLIDVLWEKVKIVLKLPLLKA